MATDLDPRYGSLIFEHIPHGIFTVDESGTITAFNSAAEGSGVCNGSRRYYRRIAAAPETTGVAMLVPERNP